MGIRHVGVSLSDPGLSPWADASPPPMDQASQRNPGGSEARQRTWKAPTNDKHLEVVMFHNHS